MHDLVPVLAVGIIVVSGISLLVAIPKPHDAMTTLREFTGRPEKAQVTVSSEPTDDAEPVESSSSPWGNLDFSLFGDSPASP